MFDYDRWLESPYTDVSSGCFETECYVCWTDCETCDATGKIDDEYCKDCDGEGRTFEQQDKYEHEAD